jgi:hypothetical protein
MNLLSKLKLRANQDISKAAGYVADTAKQELTKNLLPVGLGLGALGTGTAVIGGLSGYNTGKNIGQNQAYKETLNQYGIRPMEQQFHFMVDVINFGYKTPNLARVNKSVEGKLSSIAKSGKMVSQDPTVRKNALDRYKKLKTVPNKLRGYDNPVSKAKQKSM